MSKKYKGFKGSGYNKKSLPKYTNKRLIASIRRMHNARDTIQR